MKAESDRRHGPRGTLSTADAEALGLDILQRLVADPERLGRFFALSGLDPGSIRKAAASPGFVPAILDYVASDEELLVAIAGELDLPPERLVQAHARLSPEPDWGA
jgi:hypothetical protein